MNNSEKLMNIAVRVLDDRLAQDIEVLDVSEISDLGDYFVLATGNSSTQVRALADYVEEKAKEEGFAVHHREGYRGQSWILLDYLDVIIHVFDRESREFYGLEHMWEDAKRVDISPIIERED